MKIATAPQDVTVHGDFTTSDFNVGDVAFIVDMFADKVYSNKERAVIRELSCNAHDSHVVAGTKHVPFNVHLPTIIEPWFSVRDFGTGLSDHGVRSIFAGIGISTKRGNNETIGCFGIGSLSPYAISDSFMVKSYYNGVVRTYTCYRDDQRKPVVALLTEEATSEANGLEVSVCVKGRVEVFESEAEKVFQFWEGTFPVINCHEVAETCKTRSQSFTFEGEGFGLCADYSNFSWLDGMHAVMGNIAYKIPYELNNFRCAGYIKFDLGELEFDTARENLAITEKVRNAIAVKTKLIKSELAGIVIKRLESEPTAYDKAVLVEKINRGLIADLLKGVDFSQYMLPKTTETFNYWQSKYRGSEKSESRSVPVGKSIEYYIHKDRMSARIRSYLKDMPSGYTLVLFKDQAQADEAKIPVALIRNLEDLPKVERAKTSTGSSKVVKTFLFKESLYSGCSWVDHNLEVGKEEIVYVEISNFKPTMSSSISGSMRHISNSLEKMSLCGLKKISVMGLKSSFLSTKSFKNGNFITLHDYFVRELTKICPDKHYSYDEHKVFFFQTLSTHVQHADIEAILDFYSSVKSDNISQVCKNFGIMKENTEDKTLENLMSEFYAKYSMLEFVSEYRIEESKHTIAQYLSGTAR